MHAPHAYMHTPTRGAENQTFKRELKEEVEKAGRKRKADADEDHHHHHHIFA